MRKDDPSTPTKGKSPGRLYLQFKCECRPRPDMVETSTSDYASVHQTLEGPRAQQVIIYVYEDVLSLYHSSERPLILIDLRCEVAPQETIWDSDETLAISTDCHLLDRISKDMLPTGLVSSSL